MVKTVGIAASTAHRITAAGPTHTTGAGKIPRGRRIPARATVSQGADTGPGYGAGMTDATRLHETIADIAYIAGVYRHSSTDSRADMHSYVSWAHEFELLRVVDAGGNETYNGTDYMSAVEAFAENKLYDSGNCATTPQIA